MVDEGVFKTFVYGLGEGFRLFPRQVDSRHDFPEHRLVQRAADDGVGHALADVIEARQVGAEDHRRMSAVQDADFLFFKGLDIIGKFDVEFVGADGKFVS